MEFWKKLSTKEKVLWIAGIVFLLLLVNKLTVLDRKLDNLAERLRLVEEYALSDGVVQENRLKHPIDSEDFADAFEDLLRDL